MKAPSGRERTLLLLALLVAAGTAFGVMRLRPRLATLARLQAAATLERERLARIDWPRPTGDPEALSLRLERLDAEVQTARARVAEREERFASGGRSGAAEDLRLALSSSADACGLRVRENLLLAPAALRELVDPRAGAAVTAAARARGAPSLAAFLVLGDPHAFPVRQVTFDGDFAGLRAFLDELEALPAQVVVLRFRIESEGRAPDGRARLRTQLLLVL